MPPTPSAKAPDDETRQQLEFLAAIFGREGAYQMLMLERIAPTLDQVIYPFAKNAEFVTELQTNLAAAVRTYWLEILYRAHWAASTSLIRADRWLRGIEYGHQTSNLMVFAASLRGFLESSADTNDALNNVPYTLANNYDMIASALAGALSQFPDDEGQRLEDQLKAFTFASKGSPQPGKVYQAKNPSAYLEEFKQAEPNVASFYAELCDIVHPGANSVLSYTFSQDGVKVLLIQEGESAAIAVLRHQLPTALRHAIVLGVTNMVLLLKVINAFGVSAVHTPIVEHVQMDGMPGWEKAKAYLRSKGWRKARSGGRDS